MDLGMKYKNRILICSSTFFAIYLFYLILMILSFFGIISFQFSVITNAICLYDLGIVLIVFLIMIYFGAVVNH
jgi:hypothetical protein